MTYPAWAEPKYDGIRLLALIDKKGYVELRTRTGNAVKSVPTVVAELSKMNLADVVLDGEIVGSSFEETLSVVMRSKNFKSDASLVYRVFDCVAMRAFRAERTTLSRSTRRAYLDGLTPSDHVKTISGRIVCSSRELDDYLASSLAEGHEGVVVKDIDAPYPFGLSDAWVKLKPVRTYDGRIVDVQEGRGDARGMVGALVIEMQPGGPRSKVGCGIPHALSSSLWAKRDEVIGCWVEVASPGKTLKGRLRNAAFKRMRPDRD